MSPKKRDKKSVGNDPHRSREQAKYDQPIASREHITSVLLAEKGPMNYDGLAEKLGLKGDENNMEALRRRVGAMLRDGQLIQNRKRGLVPVDTSTLVAGRISAHPDGFGFVNTDDDEKDVYLSGKEMRQVLHGDRVVVSITGTDHRGRREGRIAEVVERANKSVVGRLSVDRGTVVVLPDNKRIHQNVLLAQGELSDAADGDMVVVEIVEQPTRRHQPVGRVVEVLGQHLRPGMEIDVALHSHGIPVEWPDDVLDQAASFSTIVSESSADGRMDVRSLPLITIDGADARDFDDAVWCERLDDGWRLIVAIADVAHYVSLGSALDNEAVSRGTSVYFPGRVVPMLPEVLSNGLCSLNPHVDRLCMLCEMTLDENGAVRKTRFHNGILKSHARLTYDQVSEMLTDTGSVLREEYAPLVPMIEELHSLYKVLAKKRRKRGAIEFDSNETHIVFDDNKKIKEIIPIQRNDAHKLIEECMILANIEAAAFLEEREVPALYRVHAGPKADRLEDLRSFLALRSLTLGGGDDPSALDYAALAEAIVDRTDRSVIQTVMLRSMQQAVYQPKNEGHFGLALDQYAHFTSPIRRYPDLLVHRAIKFVLEKRKVADYIYSKEAMSGLGESCSMSERRAEDASRDVVAWLKCEYMQDHVGSEFKGVVTAVTSFGLFVELIGIHVEGLVHITNLAHDYYKFEQAAHTLTGERTGQQYQLGDPIVVVVAAVNLEDRKIDFNEVVQHKANQKPAKAQFDSNKKGKKTTHTKEVHNPVSQGDGQPGAKPPKTGAVSAEKRRQDKRRLKQQRRNEKRKAAKEAKRLEALRVTASTTVAEPADKPARDVAKPTANKVEKTNHVKTSDGVAKAQPQSQPASSNQAVNKKPVINKPEAKKVTEKAAVEKKPISKKSGSKKATTEIVASAVSQVRKDTSSPVPKVAAKKAAKKVASKVGKKAVEKVAKNAVSKVVKKVAKKVSKAQAAEAAKKVSKAAKKVAAKANEKLAKKPVAKVAKKVAKKAVAKVTKKIAKKALGKVVKKAANKMSKATAKKVAKNVSKIPAKKVAKAPVKKIAKKVSKALAKKAAKNVSKTSAKKVAKNVSKALAKNVSKASAKKVAKKVPKASAKKVAKHVPKASAKKVAKNVSKASAKKVAKKVSKAAATNVAKNVSKAAGKKIAKKVSKTSAKKVANKVAKASAKKVAKKVSKSSAKKVAKKVAKKAKSNVRKSSSSR